MSGRQASDVADGAETAQIRLVLKSSPLSWIAMALSAVALLFAAYSIARASLYACGFGLPVLANSNCPEARAPVVHPVDEETERAAALEAESEQLERQLRLARAAIAATTACPVPPPPRRAEAPPPPPPPVQEALKLPRTVAELKGCWQSDRGDLQLVTDDERHLPTGKVRICYCFGDTGNGSINLIYTDNVICRGPIAARVSESELSINQPSFDCIGQGGRNRGMVRGVTTCHAGADLNQPAVCDTQSQGRMQGRWRDEKYHRIAADMCTTPGG